MDDTFSQIRAAAIDGRAINIFYRQKQLEQLCNALIKRSPEIREAIAADYGHSPTEIAVELHSALQSVKRDYESLRPDEEHKREYLIAAGKDARSVKKLAGIVYVQPCTHTLFYSVIVPLSAAIAAGNCVIVLLENNLRNVSAVLRQVLTSALDRDTFAIAENPVEDPALLHSAFVVNQLGSDRWPRSNILASPMQSRTVAVVDRTANIQVAAHELVAARFSFSGTSPYAPDYIFVNEFVKRDFLQAVVGECAKLSGGLATNGSDEKALEVSKVDNRVTALRNSDPNARVVLQEKRMAVVDLIARDRSVLAKKSEAPVMVVHAIRSLDHVIDLVGGTAEEPALAAFHFSNPASGKYLSQFIDARVSFVNHVSREILVGPAFPAGHGIDPEVRYPGDLFALQRPAFINASTSSVLIGDALSSSSNATASKLCAEATAPLAAMKRSPGGGVGFFEQGFLMNAGLLLTTTISVTSISIYWLTRQRRALW